MQRIDQVESTLDHDVDVSGNRRLQRECLGKGNKVVLRMQGEFRSKRFSLFIALTDCELCKDDRGFELHHGIHRCCI